MNRLRIVAPFVLILTLAACGGGSSSGGGNTFPPTKTNSVVLRGGFQQTGASAQSVQRRGAAIVRIASDASRSPLSVNLTALPLVGLFQSRDAYIAKDPLGNTTSTLVAYLTTTDGTLNGIPAVLPAPSITTQSGPALQVGAIIPAPSPLPSAPPVSLGGFSVTAPAATGQTTLTIGATVNGQQITTTVSADTYPGTCVQSDFDAMGFGCPAGLYWDAQGQVHTTATSAGADVYIADNGNGTSTLTFPYGAIELNSEIYSVSQVPTIASGPTTFQTTKLASDITTQIVGFAFNTQTGIHVKWQVGEMSSGSPNAGLNQGSLGDIYGPYLATTGTTFTY